MIVRFRLLRKTICLRFEDYAHTVDETHESVVPCATTSAQE